MEGSNGSGGSGEAGGPGNAAGAPNNGSGSGSGGTNGGASASANSGGTLNLECDTSAPNACTTPGARCESNVLIGCALDSDGCLVETERDCGEDLCDHLREFPTCSPPGGQTGDACDNKQFLTVPAEVSGDNFEADFSDRQEFSGSGCVTATVASPEAIFVVDVPAGETLSVSEVSDVTVTEVGMDAVFGIMAGCTDTTACIASGGEDDRGGISYTAADDETVAVWVSGNSALDGPYDIRMEVPESFGPLAEIDDTPTIVGGPLSDDEWDSYVIHTETSGVFAGDILGNTSVEIYDALGALMLRSNTLPHFARLAEPGTYRVIVNAVGDIDSYELEMSTRASANLGSFAADGSLNEEFPSIVDGDRRYYSFELTETAAVSITVSTTSGDPDLWLFGADGTFVDLSADVGGSEVLTSDPLQPGKYLFNVLAFAGAGDIASHTLELDSSL